MLSWISADRPSFFYISPYELEVHDKKEISRVPSSTRNFWPKNWFWSIWISPYSRWPKLSRQLRGGTQFDLVKFVKEVVTSHDSRKAYAAWYAAWHRPLYWKTHLDHFPKAYFSFLNLFKDTPLIPKFHLKIDAISKSSINRTTCTKRTSLKLVLS